MNHVRKPPVYRIKILGRVPASWSERLQGMSITFASSDENEPVTILEGPLRDQAALSGIFNKIYEMHYTVLEVEIVEKSEGAKG
jgi:hypothetical protein